ncbi:MAG: hypothetical protein ACK5LK_01800 [Chthoniobacterales bacterium]
MKIKNLPFAVVTLFVATLSSHAAVIVNWQNDAVTGTDTTAPATTVATGVSSSSLSQLIGGTAGWPDTLAGLQNSASVNSLATAISAGDYFSFTVTSDASIEASYSSLFLRYSVAANTQPAQTTFSLLSSVTGFTSLDSIDSFTADATVGGLITGTGTFDLSSTSALQSIAAETPVEFRVYIYNTGTNPMTRIGIGQGFATNGTPDLTLNGELVAIPLPEPSTPAFLGMGLAAIFVIRRGRACKQLS